MSNAELIGISGILITLATLLGNALYKSGQHSIRLVSLETWKDEASERHEALMTRVDTMGNKFEQLSTIVEERTERRNPNRS